MMTSTSLLFCLMLWSAKAAPMDLQDQLWAQLEKGAPQFSGIEAALITDGVSDPNALATHARNFSEFIASLKLASTDKPKKQARALHKNLFSALGNEGNPNCGILALIEKKTWTPQSAAFAFGELVAQAGIGPEDATGEHANLDPQINPSASMNERLACLLTWQACQQDAEPKSAMLKLFLATRLSPTSSFNPNALDKSLYNRCFQLYQEGKLKEAGLLLVGGGNRFPSLTQFGPLAYNTGVKLVTDPNQNESELLPLARNLAEVMGPHRVEFDKALDTVAYNRAVDFYNKQNYEAALAGFEMVKNPPDPAVFKGIMITIYSSLAEKYSLAGNGDGAAEMVKKLGALDKDRADLLSLSFSQQQLKNTFDAKDYEKALALASKQLGTETDRNNYVAVLTKINQDLREGKKFDVALNLLDKVPAEVKDHPGLKPLRFNSYAEWLESYPDTDTTTLLPLYARFFADPQVEMTPENEKIMRENYAITLYKNIEALLAEEKFSEAQTHSQKALAIVPNHEGLLTQAEQIKKIMAHISTP